VRVALAQINTVVGDIDGNAARTADALERAAEAGADLTLMPELTITGYPPEDLLLRPEFAIASREALDRVASGVRHGAAVIGFAEWARDCHNSAAVVADGRVQAVYRKRFLPNYGVFDEARYFHAGDRRAVVDLLGVRVGLTICEDIWYPAPVASELAADGVELVVCISASPYRRHTGDGRERMLATRAYDTSAFLAFCNLVGGQDELVFDGRSAVFDPDGDLVARASWFEEDLLLADLDVREAERRRLREPILRRIRDGDEPEATRIVARPGRNGRPLPAPSGVSAAPSPPEEVWAALVTGIRDYVEKNGFPGVVVGLSGGIDSSVTATVACDALGPGRVMGVAMPSPYSSPSSLEDAEALAEALGIRLEVIPIAPVVEAFEEALADALSGRPPDVTEENLQARARGTLLMAVSNKLRLLVLATGNKSEISVGYSTLYGDMVGGFAPLRDVAKTWVYTLARWRNERDGRELIPRHAIERPPSAELRPGQLDTDSLPPYDVLDPILEAYVERDLSPADLAARGVPEELVVAIVRMVDRAEYKRRQGPVGIKISPRAFGKDRRMPITNGYAP
jgi:NAD+ synthase (glutamine-hydrolysing)